jgi:hypothetical protein
MPTYGSRHLASGAWLVHYEPFALSSWLAKEVKPFAPQAFCIYFVCARMKSGFRASAWLLLKY